MVKHYDSIMASLNVKGNVSSLSYSFLMCRPVLAPFAVPPLSALIGAQIFQFCGNRISMVLRYTLTVSVSSCKVVLALWAWMAGMR